MSIHYFWDNIKKFIPAYVQFFKAYFIYFYQILFFKLNINLRRRFFFFEINIK